MNTWTHSIVYTLPLCLDPFVWSLFPQWHKSYCRRFSRWVLLPVLVTVATDTKVTYPHYKQCYFFYLSFSSFYIKAPVPPVCNTCINKAGFMKPYDSQCLPWVVKVVRDCRSKVVFFLQILTYLHVVFLTILFQNMHGPYQINKGKR